MPRPKLKSQTDPERLKTDLLKNRILQSSEIRKNGFIVEFPCEHCRFNDLDCIMDDKNSKCAACTRRGRPCERRFHSEKEWNKLKESEQQVSRELSEALSQQAELSAKIARLFRQQEFLRERGVNMKDHNRKLLEIMDSENPPSNTDVAVADAEVALEQLESRVLAATSSEDFDELLANLAQTPSAVLGASGGTPPEFFQLQQGSR
jgi:hypothetical protein